VTEKDYRNMILVFAIAAGTFIVFGLIATGLS